MDLDTPKVFSLKGSNCVLIKKRAATVIDAHIAGRAERETELWSNHFCSAP